MESIAVIERSAFAGGIASSDFNYKTLEAAHPSRKNQGGVLSQMLDDNFYNYLLLTGLENQPDFTILSTVSRFNYDSGDLRGTKTLINTGELNHIQHLDSFLFTIYKLLPAGSCFLGCFRKAGKKDQNNVKISDLKFRQAVKKPGERRFSGSFSRQEISNLLESHGFKLIDLTEIKDITYFCTRIMKRSGE